ncbi:MAG: hypothetical protein LBT88_07965, partial [Oscillospiraceae bacterium]|nr:hypothetical protein [Oscillospiraceae bacterium]
MKNKKKFFEIFASAVTWLAAALTLSVLVFLIGFILVKGVPHIKPSLFEFKYNSVNVSLMPALISTVIMTLASLIIAVPLGVFAAIYLTEYAGRGNKAVTLV